MSLDRYLTMIESDNLKYLINEEIFIIDHPKYLSNKTSSQQVEESKPQLTKPDTQVMTTKSEIPLLNKTETVEVAVWTAPLTAEDQTLLTKMLAAVSINFSAISLLNGSEGYENNYQKLLCFGYQEELSKKLNREIKLYEPAQVDDKNILCAPALSAFHNNPEEKRKLWTALQKVFLN